MSFNAGDVEIQRCVLSGAAGSVDVARRVHDFSTFESIKKAYVSLVMNLVDDTDVLNYNVGLDGTNTLDLSFSQPGQEPWTGKFVVTSIEKGTKLQNLRVQNYQLVGYSPHMTNFPKVQKAYKNKTGTGVARDLIESFLKPIKPLVVRAASKGMLGSDRMPYNINGVQIHKAIRQTLLRSASTKDKSSAYVFFENNKELVIDTLENLLKEGLQSPVATYYQRPMGQDFLRDAALQNFIILSLQEESRVDATSTAQDQTQSVRPFDVFSNLFKPKKDGKGDASTYLNLAYNILRPPTHLAEVMPERKRIAGKFDQQSATIVVPLNPELTVGKGFAVQTLAPGGDTGEAVLDQLAGPLLATEVRHMVDLTKKRMQGTTVAKGVRGGADV